MQFGRKERRMSREVIIKVLSEEEILQKEEEAELLNDIQDNKYSYTKVVVSPYENMGELIRCKDCKSYQPRYSEGNAMLGRCQNLNSNFVTGRGYCYWAERKEE